MGTVSINIQPPFAEMAGLSAKYGNALLKEEIFDGESLNCLLQRMSNKYGAEFKETFIDPESDLIKDYILVAINGRAFLGSDKCRKAKLNNEDKIVLMTILAGG